MRHIITWSVALLLGACTGTATPAATEPPPVTEVAEAAPTSTSTEAAEPAIATTETDEATTLADLDHAVVLDQILFAREPDLARGLLADIRQSGDTRFVAGLIDTLRYQRSLSEEIGFTLNELTGQNLLPDWFAWVEWAGQHPEIESFAGYPGWKANLFAQIDPNFMRFVNAEMKIDPDSRVEEIVWGGVRVDGIPALDNPTMIDPAQADYLEPQERVFGVSLNGDTRAYPARFLDWHEMFNDVVGGEPVSLAY